MHFKVGDILKTYLMQNAANCGNPNSMCDFYDYRYMYATEGEAVEACVKWDGEGHPPGNWIKRKGGGPDLDNPNYKSNDN